LNRRALEVAALATLVIGGAMVWFIQTIEESSTEVDPVDNRPRAPTGRCPSCKSFAKKPEVGELFDCARCGAHLRQETKDSVVEE
jgi:hypothetical protein